MWEKKQTRKTKHGLCELQAALGARVSIVGWGQDSGKKRKEKKKKGEEQTIKHKFNVRNSKDKTVRHTKKSWGPKTKT